MEPHLPFIHQNLEADPRAPRKQKHTAQRIFGWLRDEKGYPGDYIAVKKAVRD